MSDAPIPANPPPAPPPVDVAAPPTPATPPASQLTIEEQMAAFEKDLKENDWGHQPC
jgi:hypothetical protein